MNIKEGVRKLVKQCVYVGELSSEKIADQILDLVLNSLIIEKKPKVTVDPFNMGSIMLVGEVNGHNKCVDAYEELKARLRNK